MFMTTNYEASKLYLFLTSPESANLALTLKGNVAVQRNIKMLKDFFESVVANEQSQKEPSKGYSEFVRKRDDLVDKYAEKDDEGNVIVLANGGKRIINLDSFQKEFEDLTNVCKEFIDEHQKKLEEWEEYIQDECDIEIIKIKESDVKFETLSKKDFESLMAMIDSEDPEEGVSIDAEE